MGDNATISDLSLKDISLDKLPRLKKLRQAMFDTQAAICTELPGLLTDYMKNKDVAEDSPELRAGKRMKYVLQNKKAIIADNNLLAGTTTSKPKGTLIYPDFLNALSIWPELETIHRRKSNPFTITRDEIEKLNFEVFPYWLDNTIMEKARTDYHNPRSQQVMEKIAFFVCTKASTISHTIPDYSAVVDRGLKAIREEAERKESTLGNSAEDKEKAYFYKAVRHVIDGVLDYAKHLSEEADQLSRTETDPKRKQELEAMRDICARVPAEPSETFQEGLNAIWICKIALHQENANIGFSLGRLDQVLYELYRRDAEKGMSLEKAVELVGCFWLKIADHVPTIPETGEALFGGSGSNQAITLGGIDKDGNDAVNDLTYVMLRATELLGLRDPNVNCRYYPGVNSKDYLTRLCEVNVTTGATPCFHNDVSTMKALMEQTQPVSLEHARDYASVGCVEPTSSGRTYGHTGSVLMNLTAPLEMTLFQGKHRLTEEEQIGPVTKAPESITSFEDFKTEFEKQLSWIIDQIVELNNIFGKVHQEIHPTPLLSALMEGCLEKGKDVIQGGALYNSTGVAIIGLAEVVDSLCAIQEFAFEKKVTSLNEMINAINNNWEGSYEKLHQMVKTSERKFGTDNPIAKENADYIMKFLHENFQSRENYRGGKYTVGYWTMTYHAAFALLTGALPSGRVKGKPLPSGITPVSGSARDLAQCLDFMAHLDHTRIANGHALNMKYPPSKNTQKTAAELADKVDGYMRSGGMQVQCNIISRDRLIEAKKKRAGNEELLVRVSGYTAYFVDLNETMQDEIITRAEYDLETGKEVMY